MTRRERHGFGARRKTVVPCEDLKVEQWFERDRQHVSVETPSGRRVAEWWDDAVTEMVDDGFFRTRGLPYRQAPIDPRSVIEYLRDMGVCGPPRAGQFGGRCRR